MSLKVKKLDGYANTQNCLKGPLVGLLSLGFILTTIGGVLSYCTTVEIGFVLVKPVSTVGSFNLKCIMLEVRAD